MVVDVCFRKECRKSEYMLIVAKTDLRKNSYISQTQLGKKTQQTTKISFWWQGTFCKSKWGQWWYELFLSYKVRRTYQLRYTAATKSSNDQTSPVNLSSSGTLLMTNSFAYLHKTNPVCILHHQTIPFVPSGSTEETNSQNSSNWKILASWTFLTRLFFDKEISAK